MKIICNKFPDTLHPATFDDEGKELTPETQVPACRFYVLETEEKNGKNRNTGNRWKVHVDGPVDFAKVKAEFKKLGQDVTEKALKEAYA